MNFKNISYKKLHYNAKSIQTELGLYITKLNQLGYLNSYTSKQNIISKNFSYTISLNKPIELLIINITAKQNGLLKKILPNIEVAKNKLTIPFSKSQQLLENIEQKLYNLGYSFAKVKLEHINIQNKNTIIANISIDYAKKRYLDQLIIKGYPNFPKTYIKYRLDFPNKKPFNDKTLDRINNTIKELPFIKSIKAPELLFTQDSTKLYLYINKKNNSSFQGILGFNSNENKKITIYGYVKLKLSNTFNKGELITLDWNKTASNSQLLKLSSTLPYLLKSPINGKIHFKINKVDSSYTNTTSKFTIFKNSKKLEYGIGYSNLKSKTTQTSSTLKSFTQNSLYGYFQFKQKSAIDIFRDKSLYYISIKHGKATSNIANSNEIIFKISKLIKINTTNYLFIKSNSECNNKQDELRNNTQSLGGINNLKGFNENQFQAKNYSILDIEYRYLLNTSMYSAISSQISYLETLNDKINTLSLSTSLNVKQKNGLLSIMYSLGKTNETSFKLANSKINISFLTFF
jgi:hypothetical protein